MSSDNGIVAQPYQILVSRVGEEGVKVTAKAGEPLGAVVFGSSWLSQSRSRSRSGLWWMMSG